MENITVEDARKIADAAASQELNRYVNNSDKPLLRPDFCEGENCWIFFKNPDINIADGDILAASAYCVSRTGKCRLVVDFYNEPHKLADYIQKMSDYFAEHRNDK